jgi:hypothetical protein
VHIQLLLVLEELLLWRVMVVTEMIQYLARLLLLVVVELVAIVLLMREHPVVRVVVLLALLRHQVEQETRLQLRQVKVIMEVLVHHQVLMVQVAAAVLVQLVEMVQVPLEGMEEAELQAAFQVVWLPIQVEAAEPLMILEL